MAATRSRRRKRKRSFFGRLFSILLVCVAVFIALAVFFKVTEITVEGESRYSGEEIIEASGVNIGDYMMFLSQSEIANSIKTKLHYAGEISVKRNYPDKLIITVNDSSVAGYIKESDGYWLIDKNCKVLERVTYEEIGPVAEILGVTAENPVEGKILALDGSDNNKVSYLSEILNYALSQEILGNIYCVDIENVTNAKLNYLDRFTIKLGSNSDLEYKFQMLTSILEELGEKVKGTIDLSDTSKFSFQPG